MKKYIALAYFLGFFTCVMCVYGFGAYTHYRIEQMEAAQQQEMPPQARKALYDARKNDAEIESGINADKK